MQGKWNTYKNFGWALAIGVALFALLLGLLFTAFTRYGGELDRPKIQLGEVSAAVPEAGALPEADTVQDRTGRLVTLAGTADGGQGYIDSRTFLCDSATSGLRDYGIRSGGIATTQVWGSNSGSLPIGTIPDALIKYPGDGSQINAIDAAMIAKPKILVISIGQDGLMGVDKETFIANYSVTSVGANYAGADGLTRDAINWANDYIQEVCIDTGAYFCDVAHDMRDSTSVLRIFNQMLAQPEPEVEVAMLKAAYMDLKQMPRDSIATALELVLKMAPDYAPARLQLVQFAWEADDDARIISLCQAARLFFGG